MTQLSVLIIDDEEDIRDVLAEIVALFGYRATLLSNGLDAWKRISSEDFDLIITDLGLPGMDGIELLKKMRTVAIETPVLIITGVGFESKFEEIAGCLCWDYLQKPFTMDTLRAKITKLTKPNKKNLHIPSKRH